MIVYELYILLSILKLNFTRFPSKNLKQNQHLTQFTEKLTNKYSYSKNLTELIEGQVYMHKDVITYVYIDNK